MYTAGQEVDGIWVLDGARKAPQQLFNDQVDRSVLSEYCGKCRTAGLTICVFFGVDGFGGESRELFF